MKSELEEFIEANRGTMDMEVPPAGHADRFRIKLADSTSRPAKKKIWENKYVRIAGLAASFIFLVMMVNQLIDLPDDSDPEVAEAVEFFNCQLQTKAQQIKNLVTYLEPSSKIEIIADIETLSHVSLDNIHKGNISEEQQLGIIYEHYQANNTSLEMIENALSDIIGHQTVLQK